MNFFAHFFIGKEFVDTVSELAIELYKSGGSKLTSSVHLYIIDDKIVKCVSFQPESDIDFLDETPKADISDVGTIDPSNYEEFSKFYTTTIFDGILNVSNMGSNTVLYVALHFPLYKPEAVTCAENIYRAIFRSSESRPTELDFIGYSDDISYIIEPGFVIESPSRLQIASFASFRDENQVDISNHLVVIQNSSQNGISLGLNIHSLAKVIAAYAFACCENYDVLFPVNAEYKDVVSIGLSKLTLDKYLFVQYLLEKAVLNSMDLASVNNKEVDITKVCGIASNLIADKTSLLSASFSIISSNTVADEDFSKYQESFKSQVSEIITRCQDYFAKDSNITINASILAAILAKTDLELFSNTLFNPQDRNLNDLFDEPISFFTQNNISDFYKIGNEPITNPIHNLKDTTIRLINSQAQSKLLQSQLDALDRNIDSARKVEDCFVKDGVYHFNNQQFRLLPNIRQDPLSETYEAHEVSLQSVDLRSYFNHIKNQGNQGSCLAYAITSVFEYAMKRNANQEFDLSESFLYYNARKIDSNGDGSVDDDEGLRFKPAMDSLIQFGICLEKYCPYNQDVYSHKPAQIAYDDASTRKLVVAENVLHNVIDIKSALVDGYPVVVSFVLIPSLFKSTNGNIRMPTEEEISSNDVEESTFRHSMVIVGFSDSLQRFILRNSWGTDWGDEGYCYIPYQYLEDSRLCDYCCIITQIEQLELPALKQVPSLSINESDLNIQHIITYNALEKELKDIEHYKKERNDYLTYLETEKKLLSAPNIRDNFITSSIAAISDEISGLEKDKNDLIHKKKEIDDDFDKFKKCIIITSIISLIVWSLLFFGVDYIFHSYFPIWVYIIPIVLFVCVEIYLFSKSWKDWREKRDKLIRKINQYTEDIHATELKKRDFKIKTFNSWALIQALESLETCLHSVYNNMISLINNLRQWYSESKQKIDSISFDSYMPEVSLLNLDVLDNFFDQQLKNNHDFIFDFCDGIDNYKIDNQFLKKYKENFYKIMVERLFTISELNSFNITKHIVSPEDDGIALPLTNELMERLDNMSRLFLHIDSSEQGMIKSSTAILGPSINQYEDGLKKVLGKYYRSCFESSDRYEMFFIKTASLKFSECVNLRQTSDK